MRVFFALAGFVAFSAHAFSIGTAFSAPCHERLTEEAWLGSLAAWPIDEVSAPEDTGTQRLLLVLGQNADVGLSDPRQRFLLLSLLLGVRDPDTHGRSLLELENTRLIHAAPLDQYGHALRSIDDDGPEGDATALAGTRARLHELLSAFQVAMMRSPDRRTMTVRYFVDFYGLVDVEVWEPAFHLGRALHLLQDSFSHTIRGGDLKRVWHVLNYVDALSPRYSELRDGLRHVSSLDACVGAAAPLAEAARTASSELIDAALSRPESLETFPELWLELEPGCGAASEYCESPWASLARTDPRKLGCSALTSNVSLWLLLAWLARRNRSGSTSAA